tara:strand:+ start:4150 stop:4506 length:357 start_codon:yes stop_codon:yes gene_type:complete
LSDKTQILKELKSKGINAPLGAKMADLRHMAKHWIDGQGYLFRLAIPPSRKPGNPAELLSFGSIYWVPNSEFARMIAMSQLVFIMGRSFHVPEGCITLDVPKDFNDRWGVSKSNGNNK